MKYSNEHLSMSDNNETGLACDLICPIEKLNGFFLLFVKTLGVSTNIFLFFKVIKFQVAVYLKVSSYKVQI